MTERTCTTDEFTTWDETKLFYRTWAPAEESKNALILIHRGHEHSGRVQDMLDRLNLPDFWAFSWDNRGHGESPGERGHAPSYSALIKDLDTFVKHVCKKHDIPIQNIALVANSVGAVTAAAWAHDYAPDIRCMVLAAPALRIKLYVPFAIPCLRILLKKKPKATISSYVKSKMLTHDKEQSRAYDQDPLITRDISVKVLLGLHDTATRIIKDAQAIQTPALILSAGSDWVVKNSAQRALYKNLGSQEKQMNFYKKFYHGILYEKERERPLSDSKAFIQRHFSREVPPLDLCEADHGGFTKTEYDLLRQPQTFLKAAYYKIQKWSLFTLGRLSRGVQIGIKTGFDSGKSLDYIYDNEPSGITPVGRMIDKGYLNAVGWIGIRIRGEHIRELLTESIEHFLSAESASVEILDIATGCGRYVLDVLANRDNQQEVHAHLRDYEQKNLDQAAEKAKSLQVNNVDFRQADAFDPESYTTIPKPPDIAIVSGLFELFPENAPLETALKGISDNMSKGGHLIYTCQPWHPQVELIARTLTNRDGDPWIMRRRTQAEMDDLVKAAGFIKKDMKIDEYGIFTVSAAVKQ